MKHKFKKVRTWNECKAHPAVEEAWTEDGQGQGDIDYWIWLKKGWIKNDNPQRTLHEWTVREICEELNTIREGEAS